MDTQENADQTGAAADRTVVHFDHHSAEYAADPIGAMEKLRAIARVPYCDQHGGFWVLTRYDDLCEVDGDGERFSSRHDVKPGTNGLGPYSGCVIPGMPMAASFIEMDVAQSTEYRQFLGRWLSPKALSRLQPGIRDIVNYCLDQHIESGRIDLVRDLVMQIPALTAVWWLGLPFDDAQVYAEVNYSTSHTPPGTPAHATLATFQTQLDLVEAAIADRRRAPRNDLMSAIAHARIGGRELSHDETVQFMTLMLGGGVDSTTAGMSCIVHYLALNPDVRARLAREPGLMASAVEEFLRYFAPNQGMARTVTRDTEIGGQRMSAGDRVLMLWSAANHDATVFSNPGTIDIERSPNPHTSFGVGPHRCPGRSIGRMEITTLLEEILRRIPDYVIDDTRTVRNSTLGITNGYATIPATFTPGPREGATLPAPFSLDG
ncbi:MAG: cytochrome P450 [Gammaproteobacteria bacterium]